MKTFVNFLAASVRKAPWVVIALVIVVSMVLGGLGGNFTPAEDQNESFAPDAPELVAATTIGEKFGATVTRMQVLTSSTTGDVITLDGLQAAIALEESVRSGAGAEYLVDSEQQPAILSYLAPVQFAIAAGAPVPTNDDEVKALYTQGLLASPPEFQSFLTALVSEDADPNAATATYGLTSIAYATDADFDEAALRAEAIAASVLAAPTPDTITNDPFSQELIFASGDDFQDEILRMFAAAGLIILLVLAIVFLVKPSTFKDRALFYVGIALMLAGVLVAIAPSLGLLWPDVFPESWGDAELGPVLLTAVIFFAAAFILWTLASRKLRRTTADTLLTFLTIGFAIQWVNGFGFLLFEDASQLAQILPILLIGLGVDYSIHIQTRYRQELASGRSVDGSIGTAIRTVGIALVLATLTTAVGFLTNVTSSIPAIFEFGILAAIGITASFLLTLTFVPAVREVLDRRAEKHDRLETDGFGGSESRLIPRLIGSLAILPKKFAVITVLVFFVGTGFAGYAMTGLSTEFSFLDFVPTTSPIRATAVTIDENFDFPETTTVLVEGNVSTGDAWNGMLDSYTNAA
ncbi:MAG: MMPL family transporter, partial [Acidimicrobiia bacterium]